MPEKKKEPKKEPCKKKTQKTPKKQKEPTKKKQKGKPKKKTVKKEVKKGLTFEINENAKIDESKYALKVRDFLVKSEYPENDNEIRFRWKK
jgi:hypothetical protein